MALDIGAAMGGAASAIGSIFTIREQRRAAAQQFERQKELQELATKNQLDIWKKTNYGAQINELTKAGLSPALMYSKGGGTGGVTGSGGVGSAAQQNVMDVGQAAMNAAQIANLRANTEKTKAEAEKIAGVDTEKTTAETGLTAVQTQIAKINAEVAGRTKEEAINYIKDQADKMLAETVQAQIKQTIDERTYNDRVEQIKQESIGAMLENAVKDSNNRVNEARIKEISENIMQRWKQLELQGKNIEATLENMEKLTEAMLWGAGINAAGNLAGDIVKIATKKPTTNYNE